MNIRVSIDPDDIQVFEFLQACENGAAGHRVVPSEQKRPVHLSTGLVEFQVASSVVELLMLDNMRLGIAQVSKDAIVEEESAIVDALPSLSLAAHAHDRLEFPQLVHNLSLILNLWR